MNYPKKKDQMELIGKECIISGELDRTYFKNNQVKWVRNAKHYKKHYANKIGKIVGFGCTYNGKYIPGDKGFAPTYQEFHQPYFAPSKRVPHIKVRISGEGKSLKVHPKDCKIIKAEK